MLDVFYFTKALVGLSDIALIALELGHQSEVIESNDVQQLNVHIPPDQIVVWMPIEPLGKDLLSFESPQQERIREFGAVSGFIVSYHIPSTNFVVKMLKTVVERYDGWIGLDDNTFATRYDAEKLPNWR